MSRLPSSLHFMKFHAQPAAMRPLASRRSYYSRQPILTMKYATAIFAVVSLWICMSQLSSAKEPSDEIWVSLDATIKGVGLPTVNYYGALNRKVFEETLARTVPSGFLKLTHVGWMEGGKIHWLSELTQDGAPVGFSDVVYLRVETVTRIVELDEKFVKRYLLQTK
jgi:hypothetical protein